MHLLDTLSVLDWVLVLVGVVPWIAMAVAFVVERDYPARRVLTLAPILLWLSIALLVYFYFRASLGDSAAVLVLALAILVILLLLIVPALGVFWVRTRARRCEFEAMVARGEAERPVANFLLLPRRRR